MNSVGAIIKSKREADKISQEELAFGICSTSTLSRIENRTGNFRLDTALALLERLDMDASMCVKYATDRECYNYFKQTEIVGMLSRFEVDKARKEYQKLKGKLGNSKLERQFTLLMEAAFICYGSNDVGDGVPNKHSQDTFRKSIRINESFERNDSTTSSSYSEYEKALNMAYEALSITYPNFKADKIPNRLLSEKEVTAILIIAVLQRRIGDKRLAVNMLMRLREVLENADEYTEKHKNMYPLLLYNISKWLIQDAEYDKAAETVSEGIKCCISTGRFRTLPFFVCFHAGMYSGREEDENYMLKEYLRAYILFESMGMEQNAQRLRSFVKTNYFRDLSDYDVN